MVSNYINKCKTNGDLPVEKLPPSTKTADRKGHQIASTKAVYTVAIDYNDELGLMALALIDKEVKIYTVK